MHASWMLAVHHCSLLLLFALLYLCTHLHCVHVYEQPKHGMYGHMMNQSCAAG